MLDEKQTIVDLGTNAYEKVNENQNTDVEKADDGLFGKPEFYDYSGVQLPENYYYDEKLLNEFNELAGKYNLSQKSANELMSLAVKLSLLSQENFTKNIAEQQRQKINEYRNALTIDSEIGGANFIKTMSTANAAYKHFADEDVQALLQETGLNCHPKIVKMFYNIGKQMRNDEIYPVNAAAIQKESREDILFPTMKD